LYGEEFVSYNIHNLIHLAEYCRSYGTLDTFSTFSFENNFQIIKKKFKKSILSLAQLNNREVDNSKILQYLPNTIDIPMLGKINNDGPFHPGVVGNSFKSDKSNNLNLLPLNLIVVVLLTIAQLYW